MSALAKGDAEPGLERCYLAAQKGLREGASGPCGRESATINYFGEAAQHAEIDVRHSNLFRMHVFDLNDTPSNPNDDFRQPKRADSGDFVHC